MTPERSGQGPLPLQDPGRGRRTLSAGILLFRWAALAWMGVLAATGEALRRPEVAWVAIGACLGWTAWLTVTGRRREQAPFLWFDLALSLGVILVSGLVVFEGEVVGPRPFFATAYPIAAVLLWGVARGVPGGIFAGLALGAGLILSRPVNDVGLDELTRAHVQGMLSGIVNYVIAGAAVGMVSSLLRRSEEALARATEEAMRHRERAARLAERESLARKIHDSVLQALALVHKRGREMGERESVPGPEVRALAETAGEQEQRLRALIQREPEEAPRAGTASLREALEQAAMQITAVPVTVSAVGAVWLPHGHVEEIAAAARQALENVVRHAGATRAAVFADEEDGWVTVSVRDDGHGFVYDEERLRAEGRMGMLTSMKGRIEALGGTMRVETAPGAGCEVEFRVPRTEQRSMP